MAEGMYLGKRCPGDWPEDFDHENGNYWCRCYKCGEQFTGHKRRVECKVCFTAREQKTPDEPTEEQPQADAARKAEDAAFDLERHVHAAALRWCGEKDRETFIDDITYFKCNWQHLSGLRAYVEREIGCAALAEYRKRRDSDG